MKAHARFIVSIFWILGPSLVWGSGDVGHKTDLVDVSLQPSPMMPHDPMPAIHAQLNDLRTQPFKPVQVVPPIPCDPESFFGSLHLEPWFIQMFAPSPQSSLLIQTLDTYLLPDLTNLVISYTDLSLSPHLYMQRADVDIPILKACVDHTPEAMRIIPPFASSEAITRLWDILQGKTFMTNVLKQPENKSAGTAAASSLRREYYRLYKPENEQHYLTTDLQKFIESLSEQPLNIVRFSLRPEWGGKLWFCIWKGYHKEKEGNYAYTEEKWMCITLTKVDANGNFIASSTLSTLTESPYLTEAEAMAATQNRRNYVLAAYECAPFQKGYWQAPLVDD